MLVSFDGKGYSVSHNPDTRFIRDVGKSGWTIPQLEVVAGGFQQADMLVVNGSQVVFDVLLDDGPFEIRIGMVGETIGTRVNVVLPVANSQTQALYASHWALVNGDANPDSAGIVLSESVNMPVAYTWLTYDRLANSVGGFKFDVATPTLKWATPPIGQATGAANMSKWADSPGSKLESMVQDAPNVDLWGGTLGDEIPGGVETWALIRTNVAPTPSAILRTMVGLGFGLHSVDVLQANMNLVLWGLAGMSLDSFIARIKRLEYDSFTGETRLAYFEYFGAVPPEMQAAVKIGGSVRADSYQNMICSPDINGGNIGWKLDRELQPGLLPQSHAFPYGEAVEVKPLVLKPGVDGGPTFTINNPVDLITRRVGIHVLTPFAQDKIQILVRKVV